MAIIGISGKIGSGKDTVGRMLQYLLDPRFKNMRTYRQYIHFHKEDEFSPYVIKKYAGKLKQVVSLLTGIPVKDLEKQEVKDMILGDEWTRYGYADGFAHHYKNGEKVDSTMDVKDCTEKEYLHQRQINWQTAYKTNYTVRLLLQRVGTDAMRNIIHPDVWVNALYVDYIKSIDNDFWYDDKNISTLTQQDKLDHPPIYPNWIITDVRFFNEAEAIRQRGGKLIRIQRDNLIITSNHSSETDLDNYEHFDVYIDNNKTEEDLFNLLSKFIGLYSNFVTE